MKKTAWLLFVGVPFSFAHAASPAPAPAKSSKAKMVIELPTFGELPKTDGLVKPTEQKAADALSASPGNAQYEVLSVQHAHAFTRTPQGARPASAELKAITLSGKPPTSERFSTAIRARCPQKVNAPIDVMILDARGTTVMSAQGTVVFPGTKQPEVDYLVDWDPTPLRGGDYQVMIRMANQVLGTWPLKVGDL